MNTVDVVILLALVYVAIGSSVAFVMSSMRKFNGEEHIIIAVSSLWILFFIYVWVINLKDTIKRKREKRSEKYN